MSPPYKVPTKGRSTLFTGSRAGSLPAACCVEVAAFTVDSDVELDNASGEMEDADEVADGFCELTESLLLEDEAGCLLTARLAARAYPLLVSYFGRFCFASVTLSGTWGEKLFYEILSHGSLTYESSQRLGVAEAGEAEREKVSSLWA